MKEDFNPLTFLAALGAGGISIIPFALLQYLHPHGAGLISLSDITSNPVWPMWSYAILLSMMVIFPIIHLVLSAKLFPKLRKYMKTKEYGEMIQNPLVHTAILAPFISITMTLNVFVGPIRFFFPILSDNLDALMLPALLAWLAIGFFLFRTEFKLLAISFKNGFDTSKIHFGFLLHSFALSMYAVTGTGIAALSHDANIAHIAIFVSLMAGTMGMFLFFVKIVTIFQSHMAADNLPEKYFMPSMLIVIPSITLYAISLFRFGHYLEHFHGAELSTYYTVIITTSFAFATWYMLFGLTLLKDFFKTEYTKGEYYVQLWGLVCPFVGYAVLGSFMYVAFLPSMIILIPIVLSTIAAVYIFIDLLIRMNRHNKAA